MVATDRQFPSESQGRFAATPLIKVSKSVIKEESADEPGHHVFGFDCMTK